jgi:hypothetical protein
VSEPNKERSVVRVSFCVAYFACAAAFGFAAVSNLRNNAPLAAALCVAAEIYTLRKAWRRATNLS